MTGAVRPERMVSAMMPASTRRLPPNFLRVSRFVRSTIKARNFGAISMPIVPANTHAARIGSCAGHYGNSEYPFEKNQPERRGEIRSDSREQMKPRYPVKAACRKQRQMLQIALAPAPVARGEI